MVDVFSKKKRSEIMSKIRGKNTKPELLLRKELWRRGYRYRIHYDLPGRPDIVFIKKRIAIFIDGDFWHGYDWKVRGHIPPKGYWQEKIQRNIDNDKLITKKLEESGWRVLRFWEHEVNEDLESSVRIIENLS